MARPLKTGIDYFPLDVDFFVDDKVIAIVGEFGIKGEAAVIHLLCAIYRNGYYVEWGERLRSKLDRELPGVSVRLLDEIIDRLVRWGFFDKELFNSSAILTSRGIQRRYFEAVRKRKGDFSSLPYLLISPSKQAGTVVNPIPAPHPAPMVPKPAPTTGASKSVKSAPAVLKPQPLSPIISGNKDNEECRSRFFGDNNRSNIEMLMTNLLLRPDDFERLQSVADVVINEWNATGTTHRDYPDWSRHLISLIRIKLQQHKDDNKKKQTTHEPVSMKEGDYTFNGGFGGKDI